MAVGQWHAWRATDRRYPFAVQRGKPCLGQLTTVM
jgi:hypothetical protein